MNKNTELLRLVEPTVALCDAYTEMVLDFLAAGEPFHPNYFDDLRDFPAFVGRLKTDTTMHLWAVRGERLVGTVRLPHRGPPDGRPVCVVRPSERHMAAQVRILAADLAGQSEPLAATTRPVPAAVQPKAICSL